MDPKHLRTYIPKLTDMQLVWLQSALTDAARSPHRRFNCGEVYKCKRCAARAVLEALNTLAEAAIKEAMPKTVYSHKNYKCTLCGHVRLEGTNHYGEIYSRCPACAWKSPMSRHSSVCVDPVPEGGWVPEPWATVEVQVAISTAAEKEQE